MALSLWFGDTHGFLDLMWRKAQELQDRLEIHIDWIFQVGDFGVFPSEDHLDVSSRRHAEKHGYSIETAVGDFPYVLLGELEVPIPTYFIRGNHESQEFLLDLEREHGTEYCLAHPIEIVPNLFYVPDGCIFDLDGVRIAGWGGCWGLKTWDMCYWSHARTNSPRRLNHMTRDIFERLRRESFDILVTHDAPTGCGLQGMTSPKKSLLDPESMTQDNSEGPGVPQIRQLIEEVGPKYHFCGHWHESHRTRYGKTMSFVLDKSVPDERPRHCMQVIEL